LISWFITRFEPLQNVIDKITFNNFFWNNFKKLFQCHKCSAFWLTLILTQDIVAAAAASYAAYISDTYTLN
jgi:hypothetical protein